MNFIVVGTNHKYSPIEFRERISFSKRRIGEAFSFLKEQGILKGAVILSTCNRVEIYASTRCASLSLCEIENFISRYHEIEKERLSPYLYKYIDRDALKHLFSVASGIDSLIVGERQILGQVKSALYDCEEADFVDEFLKKAFHQAISFAKRMHKITKISEGKLSVGSVAIDFIKEKIDNLENKNILIIGVGKVTELVLKYLKKEKLKVTFVSNRTFDRAKDLAAKIDAIAVRFDDLRKILKKADIVITATASPHCIIRKEMIAETINHRLLILDLAVPRDAECGINDIENVELFGLEDLDIVIGRNIERKAKEAKKIKEIIEKEISWSELIESEPEPALLRLSR